MKKKILAGLLLGALLCLPKVDVYATGADDEIVGETQEAEETDEDAEGEDADNENDLTFLPTDEVSISDYVLASSPETAGAPITVRPETPDCDYTKIFRFSEDYLMHGIFERNDFFFKTANYWDTKYAFAQIEFTVSPLIQDVPASLTFFVNDRPVYSCHVDYRDGASQVCFVSIPVEYLKEGYNEFSITGFVRIYDENGCLDDFSGANWVNIAKTSCIEAGYDVIDTQNRIKYYPYPLLSTMDDTGKDLTVYVPDQAIEDELCAAFLLRAGLSNDTTNEDHIRFTTLSNYREGAGNALIVAQRSLLPDSVAKLIPDTKKNIAAGALLYMYGDEKNGHTMVLTAQTPVDLMEGAAMLMDEDRVSQEKNDWAYVPSGSSKQVLTNRSLSALIENGTTLKAITDREGLEFIGPFHQETAIYLPFSGGFILGEGGKIDLKLRYSDNLDFDRSMITVYWGDTPIASKKLEREKADSDNFSFLMPSDVVGTHASAIRIAYELEIKDLYCTHRADEMPWGFVSGDSTFFLPAGNSSTYDLSLRPYPFQSLGLFNDLAVVVPDNMTEAELTALGRTAALLGANLSPYGNLEVWKASEYQAESRNCNIVTIGKWSDNALLQKLNDKLSFKYNEDGSSFINNSQLIMNEDYAREIGVLQIIRSPYQEGRAILCVCAANDEALLNIDRFCQIQENNWTLSGDAFLIDSELNTKSFKFMEEQALQKVTLKDELARNRDAVLFTLVSTLAMFLILLGIIFILLRYRKNRREEEK